jgi:AcrR family transcriptional regulator
MPRQALSAAAIDAFRQHIGAVAEHLFAVNGYEAVTMRSIAERAGCSAMTPYRYFEDKEEIFAMIKAGAFRRFADLQERAAAAAGDVSRRLVALGRAYVDFALAEPDAYRIMFELREEPRPYPELVEQEARAITPLRTAVRDAVAGGLLSGSPEILVHLAWARVHGLVSLHLAGKFRGPTKIDELIDALFSEPVPEPFARPAKRGTRSAVRNSTKRAKKGSRPSRAA